MDSEKRGFESFEEASEELRRIIETNYNPCPARNRKPVRAYFSKITNLYHLTSKPIIVEYGK